MRADSLFHGTRRRRGAAITLALAVAFLVFALTTTSLLRVASTYTRVTLAHRQTTALFLAEAGLRKAGYELTRNPSYSGETATRLATGTFDVGVTRSGRGYMVYSVGHADAPTRQGCRKSIAATVIVSRGGFRVTD